MRDGNACEFISRVGRIPVRSQNGMSAMGRIAPTTPFCPCRDENLSPTSGIHTLLVRTYASLFLFSMGATNTDSHKASCSNRFASTDTSISLGCIV